MRRPRILARPHASPMPPGPARRHLVISGRVQGVAFRYATREAAEAHGLRGWVRNLADGRVEAVLEGDSAAVAEMVAWCRQGPPAARVAGVVVRDEVPAGEPAGFRVLPTAHEPV